MHAMPLKARSYSVAPIPFGDRDMARDTMKSEARGPWRISAVLVALSLLLPFAALLLNTPASQDALLPACCRRSGKHHCMMRMMEGSQDTTGSSSSPQLARLFEKCPYLPGAVSVAANHLIWHASPRWLSSPWQAGRAIFLVGRDRSTCRALSANYKRGPPLSASIA